MIKRIISRLNAWMDRWLEAITDEEVRKRAERMDQRVQMEAARRQVSYRPSDGSDMTTSARAMAGPDDEGGA